jgi:hypothetical protein
MPTPTSPSALAYLDESFLTSEPGGRCEFSPSI